MTPTKVTQQFYISTGRLNVFYTLRSTRHGSHDVGYVWDNYVCTLSTDEDKAIEKVREYVAAFRERVGETDDFKVVLNELPETDVRHRRGKLSARDTDALEMLEAGRFPFGKHAGENIADAPDGYLLYFADKAKEEARPVFAAMCTACLGVALEKGLIARREEKRAERAAQDALSQHVGTVGARLVVEGEIVTVYHKDGDDYSPGYWITKVRDPAGNLFTYIGNELAPKGARVRFRATVKSHDTREGVRSTRVMRPAKLEVITPEG
jgi:hypothetical protein